MYKLKERREAAGLSQSQLAAASGVPIRAIRHYEAEAETAHQDINKAEALKVYKMAKVLGCDIADILEPENCE